MKKSFVLAMFTAAMAAPAFAADNGFYIGANMGQATVSGSPYSDFGKKSDTSLGLLGGYQVNKNLAVEMQYIDFGKSYAQAIHPITTTGTSLSAVGILPVSDSFSVFGKLGMASTTLKVDCNICNPANYSVTRTAIAYGLGGQYNINQALGIRIGYDKYAIGNSADQTDGTYGVVSAGVVYKF
jgi:OOP family OmpA-OmpF porin